jgi:mono/diheme cytochrome c family protein
MSDDDTSQTPAARLTTPEAPHSHGLLAEYTTPGALLKAAEKVRDAGFRNWDTYTPFPVHGIDGAMGIRPTILPWLVLAGGLTGCMVAVTLQWWTNAIDYPFIVSGKPFWSLPANIPVTFELTVLFSALTALGAMLALNKLPHPAHSLDRIRRFARATDDRYFVLIQASDPLYDEKETRALLEHSGAVAVEDVPEDTETPSEIPRGLAYGLLIVASLATIPFALAAWARESKSASPRIHIIPDMDWQQKFKTQRANPFFADNRAMRPDIEGTVAMGQLKDDEHFYQGKMNGGWARTFPPQVKVDDATMSRGKERFGIYCTPCHGQTGEGDGMVDQRAARLAEGTWVPPSNVTEERLQYQPVGELFNSITNGIRNMPAYGHQIEPADRWAIALYVRALQRSRLATVQDVPEAERASLR